MQSRSAYTCCQPDAAAVRQVSVASSMSMGWMDGMGGTVSAPSGRGTGIGPPRLLAPSSSADSAVEPVRAENGLSTTTMERRGPGAEGGGGEGLAVRQCSDQEGRARYLPHAIHI